MSFPEIINPNSKTIETTIRSSRFTTKTIGIIIEGEHKGIAFLKSKNHITTQIPFSALPIEFQIIYNKTYANIIA